MPQCPDCKYRFQVMEDEPAEECLKCGYTGRCDYCGNRNCKGDCAGYYESIEDDNAGLDE